MAVFQDIYQAYGKPLYRFLLSLTGNQSDAEELLQETFYQAFLHIDQFEGRSSIYTWLCRIGKNAWLKECRHRSRFAARQPEELELADLSGSVEERLILREEKEKLRRAVKKLEEPYREVFILHGYGGVKLKEIALSLGKTESWARVTWYRAKQKVSEEIKK